MSRVRSERARRAYQKRAVKWHRFKLSQFDGIASCREPLPCRTPLPLINFCSTLSLGGFGAFGNRSRDVSALRGLWQGSELAPRCCADISSAVQFYRYKSAAGPAGSRTQQDSSADACFRDLPGVTVPLMLQEARVSACFVANMGDGCFAECRADDSGEFGRERGRGAGALE